MTASKQTRIRAILFPTRLLLSQTLTQHTRGVPAPGVLHSHGHSHSSNPVAGPVAEAPGDRCQPGGVTMLIAPGSIPNVTGVCSTTSPSSSTGIIGVDVTSTVVASR